MFDLLQFNRSQTRRSALPSFTLRLGTGPGDMGPAILDVVGGPFPAHRADAYGLPTPDAGLYFQRARCRAIHACLCACVAGRRRPSAIASVLIGTRNAAMFAAALTCHFVPYISACIVGEAFFPRLRTLFNFPIVSAKFCLRVRVVMK